MGFRKPHPINCLVQNNYCSKSIDCDANESPEHSQNVYRIRITGFNGDNCERRRQCISWTNFCRSIQLCTFALLLLNANVIAAEPQQNQHQPSAPCEARVLEELPPDPVNMVSTFQFCFDIFNWIFWFVLTWSCVASHTPDTPIIYDICVCSTCNSDTSPSCEIRVFIFTAPKWFARWWHLFKRTNYMLEAVAHMDLRLHVQYT